MGWMRRGREENEQKETVIVVVPWVFPALLACEHGQLHSSLSDVSHDLVNYLTDTV